MLVSETDRLFINNVNYFFSSPEDFFSAEELPFRVSEVSFGTTRDNGLFIFSEYCLQFSTSGGNEYRIQGIFDISSRIDYIDRDVPLKEIEVVNKRIESL